jgi:hypothetical protein
MSDVVTEIMCREMDKDRKRIERLETEARDFRQAFEAALRYLPEDIRDNVVSSFAPDAMTFNDDYKNDLATMRAARALLP